MFICKVCKREFETKQKLGGHVGSHNRGIKYALLRKTEIGKLKDAKKLERVLLGYNCKFCNFKTYDFKIYNGHRLNCNLNPETKIIKDKMRQTLQSPEWSKKQSEKITEIVRGKIEIGIYPKSFGRAKKVIYNGVSLHGTWELKYAKWLDENNIRWRKVYESFPYIYKNKKHLYYPDFYLIDSKEYIEIKGYKTDKDEAKWKYFPEGLELKVMFKKDLKNIGLLV